MKSVMFFINDERKSVVLFLKSHLSSAYSKEERRLRSHFSLIYNIFILHGNKFIQYSEELNNSCTFRYRKMSITAICKTRFHYVPK